MNEPVSPLRSRSSNEEVKYKIIVRLGFFPQYITMNETLPVTVDAKPFVVQFSRSFSYRLKEKAQRRPVYFFRYIEILS